MKIRYLIVLLVLMLSAPVFSAQETLVEIVPADAWTGIGNNASVVEAGDAIVTQMQNAGKINSNFTEIYGWSWYTQSEIDTMLSGKQDTLVSGTNIKTINSTSILGSGNIDITGGATQLDALTDVTGEGTTNYMLYDDGDGTYSFRAAPTGSFPGFGTLLADYGFDPATKQNVLTNPIVAAGAQNITGVKTYTVSPIVPTPTTDYQAATKEYVDDNAGGADNLGTATATDVTALFTGTTGYLKKDGTAEEAIAGTAVGEAIITAETYSAIRALLDLEPGTDVAAQSHVTAHPAPTNRDARNEEADATIMKTGSYTSQALLEADLGFTFAGGGSAGVSEVSTLPGTLTTDTLYAAVDTGDLTYKSSTGTYTMPGTYVLDTTAGTLSVSPTSWDPADGDTDTLQASQTFTYTAVGGTVNFSDAVSGLADNYFTDAATGTCADTTVLTVGQSCTNIVNFDYTLAGTYGDTLVTTSDATDSPESVTLGPVTVSEVSGLTVLFQDDMSSVASPHTPTTGGANIVTLGSGTAPTTDGSEVTWNAYEDASFEVDLSSVSFDPYNVTFEFEYTPSYTGSPPYNAYFFRLGFDTYRAYVYSNGRFTFAWAGIINNTSWTPNFTSGSTYIIQISVKRTGSAYSYQVTSNGRVVASGSGTDATASATLTSMSIGQKDNSDDEGIQGALGYFKILDGASH